MPEFPQHLQDFIQDSTWTFAKTMPKWPHEYIVRSQVDEMLFVDLAQHIRSFGYEGRFYNKPITYFDFDGRTYWTMGAPIEETIIINRCMKESTYEERLRRNKFP